MGRAIGHIYGVELDWTASKEMTKKSAKAFGGYLGASGAMNGVAAVAQAVVRLNPVGFAAVSIAQASFASVATYVAGQAWKRYFRLRYLGAPEPDFQEIARDAARDLRRSFSLRPRRPRKAADSTS